MSIFYEVQGSLLALVFEYLQSKSRGLSQAEKGVASKHNGPAGVHILYQLLVRSNRTRGENMKKKNVKYKEKKMRRPGK